METVVYHSNFPEDLYHLYLCLDDWKGKEWVEQV